MSLSFPIASRRSPLAQAQAFLVADLLSKSGIKSSREDYAFPVQTYVTQGDKNLSGSLAQIGGKGLFTKEIETALLSTDARFAVHSMKDMPVEMPDGLVLGAIPQREDVRDAFISIKSKTPWDLDKDALIGTASVRRSAQLLARRPDLRCEVIRGNVGTRIALLEEGSVDGTLLAMAGLKRLDIDLPSIHPINTSDMLPAVGQGALCVQIRSDDDEAMSMAHDINHLESHYCVAAERAFLAILDGSCRTPIAGYAYIDDGELIFEGEILSVDGKIRHHIQSKMAIKITNEYGAPDVALTRACAAIGHEAGSTVLKSAGTNFLSAPENTHNLDGAVAGKSGE